MTNFQVAKIVFVAGVAIGVYGPKKMNQGLQKVKQQIRERKAAKRAPQ